MTASTSVAPRAASSSAPFKGDTAKLKSTVKRPNTKTQMTANCVSSSQTYRLADCRRSTAIVSLEVV